MQGIEDIPAWLAAAWGINLVTAQVILSIAVIFAILLPVMLLSKNTTTQIIMFFIAECLLVGLGWLPFWILIGTIALMALAIAFLGSSAITGE